LYQNAATNAEQGVAGDERKIVHGSIFDLWCLDTANSFAGYFSGCTKVSVGSVIVDREGKILGAGANRAIPDKCKSEGCLRIKKYGEASKDHRLPSDCRAIHSEVDAISRVAKSCFSTRNCTIYVTRYPCEACARTIVAAGIKRVLYGRKQEISDETLEIFRSGGVFVARVDNWDEEDTTV
jgi:dCMP deaminase